MTLCGRVHELRVNGEVAQREHLWQMDALQGQLGQERVVLGEMAEEVKERERQVEIREEECARREQGLAMREADLQGREELAGRVRELEISVEKEQLRLLESDKYWLSRTETLLTQQQNEHERALL